MRPPVWHLWFVVSFLLHAESENWNTQPQRRKVKTLHIALIELAAEDAAR